MLHVLCYLNRILTSNEYWYKLILSMKNTLPQKNLLLLGLLLLLQPQGGRFTSV